MKKFSINWMVVLLLCGILISFSGAAAEGEPLHIVTINFPTFDFARTIVGDKAQVEMLLPPGAESHTYEPAPRDILKIQDADLFISIGGESDAWVDRILKSLGDRAPRTLVMLDSVNALEEEVVEGMQEEADEGDEDEAHDHELEYDEHIWTSPKNAMRMVSAIADTVSEMDPANSETYRANAAAYQAELTKLDQAFQDVVDSAKRKTIIVGDRFPFRYFADEFGLTYFAAFPGCSADVEPSAATVAFLIDKAKQEAVPVIFYIEFSTHKVADIIAESTGAKTLLLHSAHNVSSEEIADGATYLSLMTGNVERLREALN